MAVSFATDIRPMFRAVDINCMTMHAVFLDDYSYMSDPAGGHSKAERVRDFLTGVQTPRMPKDGPYWTQEMLDLFSKWMSDGYRP
jgi:hypothetical protein